MSKEYDYERCIIEVAPTLKKRGVEDYQETAANMCRMRVEEGTDRKFAEPAGGGEENQRSFAIDLEDPVHTDEHIEFPVIAITSGPHDEDGDQKVFIEPSVLEKSVETFTELPVYYNHQRTEEDLLGKAINPQLVELDSGKKAIKMLAQLYKGAAERNGVLEKIENGDMTHVSIDWFSKDVDVQGEPFAMDIRPIEVSFIDNETRTPVCDACTIEKKCDDDHREFGGEHEDCGGSCSSDDESCACDTHGRNSEVETMAEEQVKEVVSEAVGITEREFASMKQQLEEMKETYAELNTKHEEAMTLVSKFQEEKEAREAAEAEARVEKFVSGILEKEVALGKLDDDGKDARAEELKAWDNIKLEGFSIAMESMPLPVETERTYGKGKSHDAEETPEVEADETPRMFAMENGRIVFKGEEN
tara:strand:- start:162 stop:1415 length:1254 start_codon:yes stop_codon:yes gene_type:complete